MKQKYDMDSFEQRICDQRRAIFLRARNEQNQSYVEVGYLKSK